MTRREHGSRYINSRNMNTKLLNKTYNDSYALDLLDPQRSSALRSEDICRARYCYGGSVRQAVDRHKTATRTMWIIYHCPVAQNCIFLVKKIPTKSATARLVCLSLRSMPSRKARSTSSIDVRKRIGGQLLTLTLTLTLNPKSPETPRCYVVN